MHSRPRAQRLSAECAFASCVVLLRTSLRASDSPDKTQHQLSPPKLRIPIPCYTSYNTISPSYMPLPGVKTSLGLRTSLILVVEFHAVCRCTICGAQADGEVRVPVITMTARVDIFTKTVTSNPQTTVFGKHCECIAQKCTHLERLPPLASHLLLPSHCVLTRHGGKKIDYRNLCIISGSRTPNTVDQVSCMYQSSYSNCRTQWVVPSRRANAD